MLRRAVDWKLVQGWNHVGAWFRRITNWRTGADIAKRLGFVLRIADRLGRETGRMRFLDFLVDPPPVPRPDLSQWHEADLAACWIGHATMLLRVGGRTILTDPVFHPRVGMGLLVATVGPKRMQQPALTVAKLPPIDLIALTHGHFDHLDRPSLWQLSRRFPNVPVVMARQTRDLLDGLAFRNVHEIGWDESIQLADVKVVGVPVNHWGPRVFFDTWRTYNAYLFEVGGQRTLFCGDTAMTDSFENVAPVDLMCVGIGAYDPFIAAHATPEQAWAMAKLAGAKKIAPMHHSTFRLSHEPMDEPLRRFLVAVKSDGRLDDVVIQRVGESWHLPVSRTCERAP